MNEKEKLENIAEVSLLRTGLVKLFPKEKEFDYLAYYIHDPRKVVGIEVKQIQFSNEAALKALNKFRESIRAIQHRKNIPFVLFLINMEKEAGYFAIFDGNEEDELYPLNIDILLRKLAKSLKVDLPPEYPPYKFYRRGKESKYETWAIPLGDTFTTLRLHNVLLSPISLKDHLKLEILISESSDYNLYDVDISTLFQNRNLHDHAFFVNGNIAHTDIALPKGNKRITFKLMPTNQSQDFECTLSCEYLTSIQAQHIEKFR